MATSLQGPISTDTVRDYWDRRPCNIRHSTAPIGSAQYFQEVEARKYLIEPHIPGFADFPSWAGKRVLDVGCGIGTMGIGFARAGALYTGFELSQVSLDIAKARFDVLSQLGRFVLGDAEQLSDYFPSEKFDLVFSFGVIHHAPNPPKIIQEIRKIIAPDGVLKIMLYAKNSWKQIMIDAGLDQPEAQSGCPIAISYTPEEVRELLDGFDIVSIEQDHIFPYQVDHYVNYEYVRQPWFEAMPPDMFRALERSLGWHLCITATPSKTESN
ncbi:MAG: class I SAM-dependent methyltransferase [Chlamydiia bacterium]